MPNRSCSEKNGSMIYRGEGKDGGRKGLCPRHGEPCYLGGIRLWVSLPFFIFYHCRWHGDNTAVEPGTAKLLPKEAPFLYLCEKSYWVYRVREHWGRPLAGWLFALIGDELLSVKSPPAPEQVSHPGRSLPQSTRHRPPDRKKN